MNYCALGLAATVALVASGALQAADWPQFGFDPAHSGVNASERLLNAANVHNMSLRYSLTLPAVAEGAPVFLSGVTTSTGVKDLLFLTLNNGTLLALDAANGSTLWSQFASDTNDCVNFTVDKPCVTASSPALDPNRLYVYNYAIDGKVHRYQVADGVEITTGGWPEVVTAKPDVEQVSSALSVATAQNGHRYLYATISGASWLPDDSGDYQGHVTAIDLGSGTQVTFNVVCATQGNVHFVESAPNPPISATPDCLQQTIAGSGSPGRPTGDGGIWGRAGVVYDSVNDRIYISTGNGLFANGDGSYIGTDNWSDSVLTLPAALTTALTAPLDSYTPTAFNTYMVNDTDLGSTSIVLVPAPAGSSVAHIGVQGGKDGNVRILNLDNLSGSGAPGATGGELDVHNVPQTNEVKTQPLVWVNPADGSVMLIVANNFGISATEIVAANGSNLPAFNFTGSAPNWMNVGTGAPSSTTEGGTSPVLANGVLYYAGGSGVQALAPLDGSLLWSDASMGVANAGSASAFHKQSVIVVDGQLFVSDKHGSLWAYRGDEIFFDGFGEP